MNRNRTLCRSIIAAWALAAWVFVPSLIGATVEVTNNDDTGPGSLRDAIASATTGDDVTIAVDNTIALTSAKLTTGLATLTISGTGDGARPVIDGGNTVRIFEASSANNITFENLEFTRGNGNGAEGGALYNNGGTINGDGVTFTGNRGTTGGAIYNNGGQIELSNAVFVSNTATNTFGGAIRNHGGGTVILNNVLFDSNWSSSDGGAIENYSGNPTLIINTGIFIGNYTGGVGGGIDCWSGITQLADVLFISNTAASSGGAVYYNNSTGLTMTDVSFIENRAMGVGGAIYAGNNLALGANAVFTSNMADGNGGAVYSGGDLSVVGNTIFSDNISVSHGGAVWIASSKAATLNADTGDISFDGNLQDTSTPNSIYLNGNNVVTLDGANNIYLNDPIEGHDGNSLVKQGSGIVQFMGESVLNDLGATTGGDVTIKDGMFRLAGPDASFTSGGPAATFTVEAAATLAGQGTITMEDGFVINGRIAPDSAVFSSTLGGGVALTTAAGGQAIGTLTLDGDATFDNMTYGVDLDASGISDRINVTGEAAFVGTNTLDITTWASGTFVIGEMGSYDISAADPMPFVITVDGQALGQANTRNEASWDLVAAISGVPYTAAVQLVTSDTLNVRLTWTGSQDGDWSATGSNWTNGYTGGLGAPIFRNGDAVIFDSVTDAANTGSRVIAVDAAGVTVASMKVDGDGNYTFSDGTITGTTGGTTLTAAADVTGRLDVANTYTGELTFNNAVAFQNGINVAGGATSTGTINLNGGYTGGRITIGTSSNVFKGLVTGSNVVITGQSASNGGAIYNTGSVTLDGADFTNNRATSDGGAIYSDGGDMTISNAVFVSNTAGDYGGAIRNHDGRMVLNNVLFDRNWAPSYGGAIENYSGNPLLIITNGTFSNNYSDGFGGALDNWSGSAVLTDVVFTSNTAKGPGGAIYNNYDTGLTLAVSDGIEVIHTGNVAFGGGGAPSASAGGFMYTDSAVRFDIGDGGSMAIGSASETDGAVDSISGSSDSAIEKDGLGTLTINSDVTNFYGSVVVNEGTLSLGREDIFVNIASLDLTGPGATFDLQANQTLNSLFSGSAGSVVQLNAYNLTLAGTTDTIFSGTMLGSGTLIKEGDTMLTLVGSQAIANNTLLNEGVIKFSDMTGYTGPLKYIHIDNADAWLDLSDTSYDNTDGSTANDWSGLRVTGSVGHIIGGNDAVNLGSGTHGFEIGTPGKEGVFVVINAPSGTAVLTSSNSYVGYTRIDAGTLLLTGSNQIGPESGIVREVILNGGNLAIGTDYSNTARVIEQRKSGAVDVMAGVSSTWNSLSGTSTAAFTKTGSGTLNFAGNATTGTMTVSAGILNVAGKTTVGAFSLAAPTTANLNGGSLGVVNVAGTLNLSGTTTMTSGTLSGVANNTGNTTVTGNLAGTGTMNNTGVLVAKNLGGTLLNSATATVGSVTVQVRNTGRITLAGSGTTTFGTLSGTNGVVNFFNRADNTAGDRLVITGNLSDSQTFGNVKVNFSDYAKTNAITISGTATGAHTLQLVRDTSGGWAPDPESFSQLIVGVNAGTATFAANSLDDGMYTYLLQKGDGGLLMPNSNNWYLSRTSTSRAGDAILMTAGILGTDWHYSLDSLYLRMGELRAGPLADTGNVWVRANAYQLNAGNTVAGRSFDQRTYNITAGIDKNLQVSSGSWLVGGFLQMGESDRDHGRNDDSDTSGLGAGIYVTYLHSQGWYFDGVAKYDRYKNTLNARAADGYMTSAEYNSKAQGLSVEFGRRFTVRNYWFEPSVQAAVAWLNGASYDTNNGMHVRINSADAWQYRAQLRGGLTYGKWMPYAKLGAVASDTNGGEVHAQGRKFQTDFDGVRVETGVGTAYFITNRSQVYLDYEYGRAEQYERPWSINLGYRCAW